MKNHEEFPTYPPLFIIRITEELRNLFLRLYRKFTHPNVAVFEMVHHFWLAAALGVAADLGIADKLKVGAKSIRELAVLTNTHEESLYRLMRMLASHDIFKEINEKYFTLTPLAKSLQQDQVKFLITSHLTKLHFQMFGELMFTIRTGKKSSELFMESTLFEHIGEDEQRNEQFNKAMTSSTMMQVAAILPAFSFRRFRNIIDVGGGQGLLLAAIIRKYRGCKGIVFDLPQSTAQTMQIFEKYEITNRVEIIAGSFFERIPEGGDLYILKSILHNWDDESCLKILSNIYKAMTSTSRLLIIESVIDEGNEPSFGKMTDILMMVAVGGKERTKAEYKSLLTRAGFRIRKIHPTISPHRLIEAEKV